ncbi:Transcriptional regulator, TetR family [Frankia canadensis]|uniref:Transcriptional regulator, TetR family n=1 Tax=Frankia canadensis TaxID=1836972 RepID=A0A2I2KKP4_9ACTN|nr:TetR/AcrR family transcriptional regulator [Frankia canadensis]SNQ46240.1 Transcriptional regulator, TetR family [Frankia canadensis]SOU53530.1 Transcriptional regulator, TetR family [Frankia canadensis]
MAVQIDQGREREQIMNAAYRCLIASEGASVSITDILQAAGLSTRAFYRHFASKDSLLLAMFRRDSERVTAELSAAAAGTLTAAEALRSWIDGALRLMSQEPRRRRALVLSSDEARRARGYAGEREWYHATSEAALAAILRRGVEDGSFPWANPEADAEQIQAILGYCLDTQLLRRPADGDARLAERAGELADRVGDFIFRALGAAPGPTPRADTGGGADPR